MGWLGRPVDALSRDRRESAYRDYLSTDAGIELSRSQPSEYLVAQDYISNTLSEVLGEESDPHSSTAHPLLALPNLKVPGPSLSGSEVVEPAALHELRHHRQPATRGTRQRARRGRRGPGRTHGL